MIKFTIREQKTCGDGEHQGYEREQVALIEHQHGVREYQAHRSRYDDNRKPPLHGILNSPTGENRDHGYKSD